MPTPNSFLSSFRHPVNKVLSLFGFKLSRINDIFVSEDPLGKNPAFWSEEFEAKYESGWNQLKDNQRGFKAYREHRNELGAHPQPIFDSECEFATHHLYKAKPLKVLDIGSYRIFTLGLLAHHDVTSLDIRKRHSILDNETVITCDAKALNLPNNSFDSIVTMGTLSHVGLGRYGDEIDFNADIKCFNEMVRVLKPGGILIFTAAITGGPPSIAWNARRNYSYDMIRNFCKGLDLVEEKFLDRQALRECSREELCTKRPLFDYYLGCWRKK